VALIALPARGQLADIRVNDNSTDGANFTQSETALAIRTDIVPSHVCVAWNDTEIENGRSGYGISIDGGSTFADAGGFPVPPSPAAGYSGDPSVAFSRRDGLFYYTAMIRGAVFSLGLFLWRSSSCGVGGFAYRGKVSWQPSNGYYADREMIAVDNNAASPCYGRTYVAFFSPFPEGIIVGWSDDPDLESDVDGWPAAQLALLPGTALPGPAQPQAPWIAVAPNGDVYVAIVELTSAIGSDVSFRVFESAAGGPACAAGTSGSWVEKQPLGSGRRPEDADASLSCEFPALDGNVRYIPAPQLAIQPASGSPPYVIHAVYGYDDDGAPSPPNGLDEANVFYRRSTNGADSWSPEFKLNWDDATATDQWQPSIAVAANGVVAATWYDRRAGWPHYSPRFFRAATLSMDGGLTWERTAQLSDVISDVTPTGPQPEFPQSDPRLRTCYHGDYDQIAVDPSGYFFHALWSDDRALLPTSLLAPTASCEPFTGFCPNPDVYYQRIEDASPADGVYEPWDICNAHVNPRVATPQPWMTLMSRQRDGDADGFGNVCDPDYTNGVKNGSVAGNLYLHYGEYAWMNREMYESLGKPVASQTCGRPQNRPCDFFDKNEDGLVDSADYGLWAQGNPARPIHNAWYTGTPNYWPNPLNTRSGPSSCVNPLTGDFSCEWQTECCGPWCGPAC
jgi:hypothetical protein